MNLSFNTPLVLLQAPKDAGRWFVGEQAGQVLVFDNDPMVTAGDVTTFIDISGQVTSGGERGLLGMAFHPNFPATPHVFLSFTGPDPNNGNIQSSFVSQFTSVDGGLTLDPTTELVIIKVVQPFPNHNGGNIAFGPMVFCTSAGATVVPATIRSRMHKIPVICLARCWGSTWTKATPTRFHRVTHSPE